jgi:ribosome maturation factor RimP
VHLEGELRRRLLLEKARIIVLPILEDLGYDLVDLTLVVSHGRRTLRVFINSRNGITLEDCARASKHLSPVLDQYDLFMARYYLEVSSPGAERKLKSRADFEYFVGRKADIRFRGAAEGMNQIKGTIASFDNDVLTIRPVDAGSVILIPFDDISSASLCL